MAVVVFAIVATGALLAGIIYAAGWLIGHTKPTAWLPILILCLYLPFADSIIGRFVVMPHRCSTTGIKLSEAADKGLGLLLSRADIHDPAVPLEFGVGFVEYFSWKGQLLRRSTSDADEREAAKSVAKYELRGHMTTYTSSYRTSQMTLLDRERGIEIGTVQGHAFLGGFLERLIDPPSGGYAFTCQFQAAGAVNLLRAAFVGAPALPKSGG